MIERVEREQIDPGSVRGSITPAHYPRPLVTGPPGDCPCGNCAFTPSTTFGFDVILFARDVLRMPLDPWQEFLVIHAGELLPDGRPRFKKILLIVARQNGKTFCLMVLALFWLFVECWKLIVGQSTTLAMARELWTAAQEVAEGNTHLAGEFGHVRKDNNDPFWRTAGGSKYKPAAANRRGARGGAIDRLLIDELREQLTWEASRAAMPTMNARPYAQAWLVSNQGDAKSVVLLEYRKTGIANIEAEEIGEPPIDEELGLFEWSSPKGASMTDVHALAAANPNMNYRDANGVSRVRGASLLADARGAQESGDQDRIIGFKTEIMCLYVPSLDAAIDPDGWEEGAIPGTLDQVRNRLALVPELSPDGLHASVTVAAMEGEQVRVEVIASWSGPGAATQLRRNLLPLLRQVKPRKLGWLPNGPVAAIAAELKTLPHGIEAEEIRADVPAVCMGFAELAGAGDLLHSPVPEQELLDKQTLGCAKLWRGDVWVFSRKGEGHCDATYGAAGAAWLARTMPPPIKHVGGLVVVK